MNLVTVLKVEIKILMIKVAYHKIKTYSTTEFFNPKNLKRRIKVYNNFADGVH